MIVSETMRFTSFNVVAFFTNILKKVIPQHTQRLLTESPIALEKESDFIKCLFREKSYPFPTDVEILMSDLEINFLDINISLKNG